MKEQPKSSKEKLLEICKLLDKIDCCEGYSIGHDDYPLFWIAQQKAREILKKENES